MRPRVVVVDDHDLFRGGLVGLLQERNVDVVGDASTGAEGVELARRLRPDVVLMDLNMPGMPGVEATHRMATAAPTVKVLIVTIIATPEDVVEALMAGACGYLLKDAPIDQLVGGVLAAVQGDSVISPAIAKQLVRRLREPPGVRSVASPNLTVRERDVLALLTRGLDNGEIANTLFLSPHTVKNHVSSILAKLRVENRIQAAVLAVRAGLA